ncbi:hypothetical protein D3C86_1267450 [compost metagenome]
MFQTNQVLQEQQVPMRTIIIKTKEKEFQENQVRHKRADSQVKVAEMLFVRTAIIMLAETMQTEALGQVS